MATRTKRSNGYSVDDVSAALQTLAPTAAAESWDNVGLLAGDRTAKVRRVLSCIDLMPPVVAEAIRRRVQMVIAYHPPIFKPVTRLVSPGDGMEPGVMRCIARGIAIYSPHTALDVADGGTNDVLASLCDIVEPAPVEPQVDAPPPVLGMGRMGRLAKPIAARALAKKLKRRAKASCVALVGDPDRLRRRAIVGVGAAGSMAFSTDVGEGDVIVTGEMRHHDALHVQRVGAAAIVLSHWSSERPALASLGKRLEKMLPELEVVLSEADAEPFQRA